MLFIEIMVIIFQREGWGRWEIYSKSQNQTHTHTHTLKKKHNKTAKQHQNLQKNLQRKKCINLEQNRNTGKERISNNIFLS